MVARIHVQEFHRVEFGCWVLEGRGSRGPMKSLRVLQHVPSLIHCLGWTKSPLCFRCKHWLLYGQTVLATRCGEIQKLCVCGVCVLWTVSKWVSVCVCCELCRSKWERKNEANNWEGVKLTFPNNNLLLWLNMQWQLKFNTFPLLVRMCALAPKSSF